ncbi:MAG: PH domain-containing protein [Casimicrobiaceae bacterium]
MSYIDSNLLAGEEVVYRTRLHWLLFMAPVLVTVFVLLPAAWLLSQGSWSSFAWVPLALGACILLAAFIKRQSSDFAVTNKRVMMKVGVFSTRSIELLLNKIEAITVNQNFMGRIFGYGDIVVTGSGGTREAFSHIEGPLEFRRAVQSVTDRQSMATGSVDSHASSTAV